MDCKTSGTTPCPHGLWGSTRLQTPCPSMDSLGLQEETVGEKKGCDVAVALEPIASNFDIFSPFFHWNSWFNRSFAFHSIDPQIAKNTCWSKLAHRGGKGAVGCGKINLDIPQV